MPLPFGTSDLEPRDWESSLRRVPRRTSGQSTTIPHCAKRLSRTADKTDEIGVRRPVCDLPSLIKAVLQKAAKNSSSFKLRVGCAGSQTDDFPANAIAVTPEVDLQRGSLLPVQSINDVAEAIFSLQRRVWAEWVGYDVRPALILERLQNLRLFAVLGERPHEFTTQRQLATIECRLGRRVRAGCTMCLVAAKVERAQSMFSKVAGYRGNMGSVVAAGGEGPLDCEPQECRATQASLIESSKTERKRQIVTVRHNYLRQWRS